MQPEDNKSTSQKVIDSKLAIATSPLRAARTDMHCLLAITPGNDAQRHHVGDTGRQGPLDSARAAIVPDSMKSDSQHAKDYTKGKADDLGSHAQPDGSKSTSQKVIDSKR